MNLIYEMSDTITGLLNYRTGTILPSCLSYPCPIGFPNSGTIGYTCSSPTVCPTHTLLLVLIYLNC